MLELSKMYKTEGHKTHLMNCDTWTFEYNKKKVMLEAFMKTGSDQQVAASSSSSSCRNEADFNIFEEMFYDQSGRSKNSMIKKQQNYKKEKINFKIKIIWI